MANILQLRRGTTAQNNAFTGSVAEVTVDTDKKSLRIHDGVTMGGHELSDLSVEIPQLSVASSVSGADELVVQQGGVAKRAAKSSVLNGIVDANVDPAAGISGTKLANDTITNAKIKSDAAIAGSKIDPQFVTPASIAVSSSTDPALRLTQTGSANCFTVFDETSDTTPFVIGPSGRVGIQTSAPEQALHVNCDGGNGILLEITDNDAAGDPMLSLRRNSASPAANDQIGYISFVGNDSAANNQNYAAIYANILDPTSGSEDGSIQFWTTNSGTLSLGAVVRNSRLGVNEPNPDSAIHAKTEAFTTIKAQATDPDSFAGVILQNDARAWRIQVQGDDSDKLYFYDDTAAAVRMAISATGNVGIGTAIPDVRLHAQGAAFVAIKSKTTSADSSAAFVLENDARDWRIQVQGGDGDKLYFYDQTATAARMIIDSSGNVGIGTSAPASRLHVVGDLTIGSATTTTAATAGANGDVPAQVAGYLVVSINGTSRKMPFYAT